MADHLIDDEAQELLGEVGVEIGVERELAQARNLAFLAARVGRRQVVGRLISPTAWVTLNRSASMKTSAASILSMLSR